MNLRDWFLKHSPQEQVILTVVGVVLVVGLLYATVIHPLSSGMQERRARVKGLERELASMQKSAAEVRALKQSGGNQSQAAQSNQAPYLLVDSAVRRAKLTAQRIAPAGGNGVKVQFSQVEFNALMRVLGTLQTQQGLSITALNADAKAPGTVRARISLERQ